MDNNLQVAILEKHNCPFCQNKLLILNSEKFLQLTPEEEKIYQALQVNIVKTGDIIVCPFCKKQILVKSNAKPP